MKGLPWNAFRTASARQHANQCIVIRLKSDLDAARSHFSGTLGNDPSNYSEAPRVSREADSHPCYPPVTEILTAMLPATPPKSAVVSVHV